MELSTTYTSIIIAFFLLGYVIRYALGFKDGERWKS